MGHTYPVDQIIRNEGDKADPPKHLGHFCPALFRCFQPLSLSHKLASARPFATSFRFEATILDLEDVSYQHDNDAAVKANPNSAAGETHFNLKIVSLKFEGLNLVKQHRLVYDALVDELQSELHALSIVAKTLQELESQPKCRPDNRPSLPTPKFQHFISFSLAFPQSLIAHSSTLLIPKASDRLITIHLDFPVAYMSLGKQQNGARVIAVDCTADKVQLPMTALIEVSGDQLDRAAGVGSEEALRDGTALVSATDCLAEEAICQPNGIGSIGDIEQNNGLSLPFVKTFSIWQQFESMEVFRKLPQNPHFQPSMKSKRLCREGLAIGNMFAFVSLVEMIAKLEIDAPAELANDATEAFVELENMGFNVKALRVIL
ncbi:hypothetical protein FEM48_Zijuj04G0185500 [Ziziphus jujuba var. spinosa]|uniref:SufE-like protein 1, chloroplastic/mitochondrial n=1 Tax=Ziziphus jujuba var. spinosa TaxID=714518 RepID=A0A978VLH6_ZIZJJ|nr:hypothetical protein FEM48_Zijuj04G0185500 [Ziziphus jujuba var. spinosa]